MMTEGDDTTAVAAVTAMTSQAATSEQRVVEIDGLYELGNGVLAHRLRAICAFDNDGLYREDGVTSMQDWICLRDECSWDTAGRLVALAHGLAERPAIEAAFERGALSQDKAEMLCGFVPQEDDEEWAERGQHLNAAQIKAHLRSVRRRLRREAEEATQERTLSLRWNEDKAMLRINGLIYGAEGAVVFKALDRQAEQAGANEDGTWDPYHFRLADALVEVCRARLAEDSDADRATVVCHVDIRDLNAINGNACFSDGPFIPSEVARRLSCDARLQVVINGPDGKAIGIGRTSRVVPAWMYRELKRRDVSCVVCGRGRGVQAHHVKHWAHGGKTDLDNLVLLCWKCHRFVHDEHFFLTRNQHGTVILVRPDGVPVRRRPISLRPEVRERMLGPGRKNKQKRATSPDVKRC